MALVRTSAKTAEQLCLAPEGHWLEQSALHNCLTVSQDTLPKHKGSTQGYEPLPFC